ncbi:MAG: type II toxin-antitoxin system PemK/MazF family toxin [Cyanobacteria bacterium P01_A01_bin.83]
MAIKRGEIYFVDLNPVTGKEQAGKRPILVLSIDVINQLPLVITLVIGTKGENISRDYPTNVRVAVADSGLPLETVFLCFQIRSLDASRFTSKPAGYLTQKKMNEVESAVRYCLGLE